MKSFLCKVLSVWGLLVMTGARFINNYDQYALMECPSNQYLSYIYSIHSNRHEDRVWEFRCHPAPTHVHNCGWTDYLNNFDELLAYMCPGSKVMTGMKSYHDNGPEDRRFSFKCCDVVGKTTPDCYFTPFLHNFDQPLEARPPSGYVFKGGVSIHHDGAEDRIWRFIYCRLQ